MPSSYPRCEDLNIRDTLCIVFAVRHADIVCLYVCPYVHTYGIRTCVRAMLYVRTYVHTYICTPLLLSTCMSCIQYIHFTEFLVYSLSYAGGKEVCEH